MSFKSDTDVLSRENDRTCQLTIKIKGVPHMSSDGRNMTSEFISCIFYLFAGFPFVRMINRVGAYVLIKRMMIDYGNMAVNMDVTLFESKTDADRYFYFLFYMQCDQMDYEMSNAFVRHVKKAVCDIMSDFDGCTFVYMAFHTLIDDYNDFKKIIYVPNGFKRFGHFLYKQSASFDLWEMFWGSAVVYSVTNGCDLAEHICNEVNRIFGTESYHDIVKSYIRNVMMPNHEQLGHGRHYEVHNTYDCDLVCALNSGHFIYAIWQEQHQFCYVGVVDEWTADADGYGLHVFVFAEGTDYAARRVGEICGIDEADALIYVNKAFNHANTMYMRKCAMMNSLNYRV